MRSGSSFSPLLSEAELTEPSRSVMRARVVVASEMAEEMPTGNVQPPVGVCDWI